MKNLVRIDELQFVHFLVNFYKFQGLFCMKLCDIIYIIGNVTHIGAQKQATMLSLFSYNTDMILKKRKSSLVTRCGYFTLCQNQNNNPWHGDPPELLKAVNLIY